MPKVKKLKYHEHSHAKKAQLSELEKKKEDVSAAKCVEVPPQQLQVIVERNRENKLSKRALEQILEQQLRELNATQMNAKRTEESNLNANRVAHEKFQQLKSKEQHVVKLVQDLQIVKVELEKEKREHSEVLAQNMRLNRKFTELETRYDKEIQSLKTSHANKVEEIKEKDMQCLDLMNQFAVCRKQYETNLEEQNGMIINMKNKSNEDKHELQRYRSQNEELLAVNNELKQQQAAALQRRATNESEMEELRRQLAEKDEAIETHQKQYYELERAKNQSIKELSFKIRKIENVFEQPVKVVPPLRASSLAPNAATDRTSADAAQPIILSNELIVEAANDIIPPPRPQTHSQYNQEQDLQTVVLATPQRPAMPQPINTRRRRLPPTTYQLSPNEFASDDNSDTDWQPRLLSTLMPNGYLPTARRNLRNQSPEVVPDSPVTSNAFDRVKRTKPN